MIGYKNPNTFVKKWEEDKGSFDKNKNVWVITYIYKEGKNRR